MAERTLSMQELARMALLSPRQRELVSNDIAHIESALYGRSMHSQAEVLGGPMLAGSLAPVPVPEPELLREHLRHDQDTLARGTAPELTGFQKDRLWKLVKREVEAYREGLLADSQMQQATAANVEQFMRHEDANRERALAIKNAMAILDPSNEALSLEVWRPADPVRVDWKSYFTRFDAIQWTNDTEREIAERELDDETYTAYLKLRAAGITTQKLIERKLGISQATFEACEARLKAESLEMLQGDTDEDDAIEDEMGAGKDKAMLRRERAKEEIVEKHGDAVLQFLMRHKGPVSIEQVSTGAAIDIKCARTVLRAFQAGKMIAHTAEGWVLVGPDSMTPDSETYVLV